MSTATHSESGETYRCSECDEEFAAIAAVAGSFCSMECHRSHRRGKRAREVMRELEHDHRFCATCGRQLKEIERPIGKSLVIPPSAHDDWAAASDVLVGFQHRTQHAETGEISLDVDDRAERPIVEDTVTTGTICECGNTAHRHEEGAIRERAPFETAYYVALATRVLRAEDKHDVVLDRRALFDAVLEQAVPVEAGTSIDVRGALRAAVVLDD